MNRVIKARKLGIFSFLRPEELLLIPFFILLVILLSVLNLKFSFLPRMSYWIAILALFYCLIFISGIIAKGIKNTLNKKRFLDPFFPGQIIKFLRSWIPLIAIFVIYENLHDIIPALNLADKDYLLLKIDLLLFGSLHPSVLLQSIVTPALTSIMNFAYFTLFLYIPLLGGIFYFSNKEYAWNHLLFSITLTAFLGFIGYLIVPGVGPQFYIKDQYSINLDGDKINNLAFSLHESLRVSRDIFPSLHTAFSAVSLFIAYRYARRISFLFMPFIFALWFSTIYLRYHYLVDVIAGFALAFFAFYFGDFVCKKWYGKKNQKY